MFELRNALLAAYLEGEPASVAVLNDFLLEQGEDPRKLQGNAERRMRVVLGLVSAELSQRIACDFAEHVVALFEAGWPDENRVRTAIETKRRWLNGQASSEELKRARKDVLAVIAEIPNFVSRVPRRVPASRGQEWVPGAYIRRVIENAARAAFHATTTSDCAALHCAAAASRAARRAPDEFGLSREKEIQWQIKRLRSVLSSSEVEPS